MVAPRTQQWVKNIIFLKRKIKIINDQMTKQWEVKMNDEVWNFWTTKFSIQTYPLLKKKKNLQGK